MLADRRHVGEQRVGRHARSDGRKQGYKRIERNARDHRQYTIILDSAIGAKNNIFPTAPGNLRRRARAAAAAAFDGTQLLQGQRLLRWRRAWRKNRRVSPLVAIVLKLETIDDARRHQYGGGKPRKEIVQPSLAGAMPHGISPRRGRQQGACSSTLRTHRFQARELASTLDERGWSSSGPTEVWLHGHDLGGKLGKSPERRNYMVLPGIILGPSQWQGCVV